jgi:hypothetical protein
MTTKKVAAKPQPWSETDVLTILQMAKRLKMRSKDAYNLKDEPGFPLYNLGGPNKERVIWGEVLDYIRKNKQSA